MAVKHAILGLLHYKKMHGYHIKERIESTFSHLWTINYGQIYPTLKKLQQEGLVTMLEVAQQNAPTRKLYSITAEGREAFRHWLKSDPEKGMILRDPFLSRMLFFGFGEETRALELIEDQIVIYKNQLAHRQSRLPRWQREDIYVRLVAELGISLNETMLDWLCMAEKRIREHLDNTNASDPERIKAQGK